MQRYNFQFTGQRFYRIANGKLAGQLKDVAYQATTTDFWGAMEAVGGASTWVLGGAFNCGKGQPGQVAPVSHGCPSVLVRGVRVLEHAPGVGALIPAQELVERGIASADALGADGSMVLVEETSHVDVRFALNTTTTNGVQRGRSVSVIALAGGSVGSARRTGEVGIDGVADMAAAALADARGASPASDAFALVTPGEPARHATSDSTRKKRIPGRWRAFCPPCPVRSAGPGSATPYSRASRSRTSPRCISAAPPGSGSPTRNRRRR